MKSKIVNMLCAVCLSGCGLAEVRNERAAAVEMGKAITLKIIDKAKLDQSSLGASAQVTNPEYQFEFFGGTGLYAKGVVRAIGVDVKAQIAASGTGEINVVDTDLRDRIDEILSRRDWDVIKRKEAITNAIIDWLHPKSTTQPSDTK